MPLLALAGYSGNANAITPATACAYTFGAIAGANALKRFINTGSDKEGNTVAKCVKTVWYASLCASSTIAAAACTGRTSINKNFALAAATITAADILFQRYFTQNSCGKEIIRTSTASSQTATTKPCMTFWQKAETAIRTVPAFILAGYAASKYLN